MTSTGETSNAALVTGGSRGIGYELATLCARDGYDLVLVAREKERLLEVADELESTWGITTTTLSKDLSRPESASEIYDEVQRTDVHVDVLVNNAAARPTPDRFEETALGDTDELLQVNVVTLTHLIGLFLAPMVERGTGRILNVSSVAGEVVDPRFGVYTATKSYVSAFSKVLARQLDPLGITVTVLVPGWTDTDMARDAFQALDIDQDASDTMAPADVARAGYEGLMNGRTQVIPGRQFREAVQVALSERAANIDS